ncbi:MAG: FKBP-type peptidyl-prolyl cis-trans isomerase [Gemmataceae bacterium]
MHLLLRIALLGVLCLSVACAATDANTNDDANKDKEKTDKTEPNYTTTKSGLKYADLAEGTGDKAQAGDTVDVHYTGRLKDGTKFDSSLDRGQPISFRLGAGRVIKGWDEGIAGMRVGGKRKLVIPPDLAYGKEGRPPVIPANAELQFDVELVKIR